MKNKFENKEKKKEKIYSDQLLQWNVDMKHPIRVHRHLNEYNS